MNANAEVFKIFLSLKLDYFNVFYLPFTCTCYNCLISKFWIYPENIESVVL